jgi:hypothetical protein
MVLLTGYFSENKTQKIKTQQFLSGFFEKHRQELRIY